MFQDSEMETVFSDVDQIAIRQKNKTDEHHNGVANGNATTTTTTTTTTRSSEFTPRAVTAVVILNIINLLNYADRGTVPGEMIIGKRS